MKGTAFLFFIAGASLLFPPFPCRGEGDVLTISTTTSTQASGLLDVLLPEFEKATGIAVKVIARGTGAAIRDGMDGNVDLIFVHALSRENEFVADGHGTSRTNVMHNDFVILGPGGDPAGVRDAADTADAFRRIAAAQAPFVSRGDDSGTHTRELEIWKAAAVERGEWYLAIGQGMGKTLTFADEKGAYTLADRGTFIKYKHGRKLPIALEVLSRSDPALSNPYGVIPVNPARHPHVRHDLAERFVRWLTSERGQSLIAGYRVQGMQLFYPDAGK